MIGQTFVIMVSWEFPFEANGGAKVSDLAPQAPNAVKKSIDAILSRVPGYNQLSNAQKAIVKVNATKLVEIVAKKSTWSTATKTSPARSTSSSRSERERLRGTDHLPPRQ